MSDPIVISLIVLVFILLFCWAISGASANEWKENTLLRLLNGKTNTPNSKRTCLKQKNHLLYAP